jgi:hypothetical protein
MSLLDDVSIVVTPNGYKAGELYAVIPVPTEGAELVINGDFATDSDWSKATGVTISGGNAIFNNSTANNNGIYQAAVFQANTQYKITAEVSNYSSGNLTAWSGGSQNINSNESFTGNGTKTWIISTGASNGYILLSSATTNGNFNIDNVSVKEYTSADMDVTRATAATRVDENGLVNYAEVIGGEEVTDGDFPSGTTAWSFGGGWSLGVGVAEADGSTSTSNLLTQDLGLVSAKTYTISFSSNRVGGTLFVKNSTLYSSSNIYTLNTGTGLEVQTFTVTSPSSSAIGFYAYDYEGTIDDVTVKQVDRANVPRIDYTGGGCPHILAEPQRTNLITYSEDFSNAYWTKSGATVESGFTSPDGTDNAFKLVEGTSSSQFIRTSLTVSTGDNTISIFAKADERDWILLWDGHTAKGRFFDVKNGNIGGFRSSAPNSSSIDNIGNGWYRCSITVNSSSTNLQNQIYLSDGDGSFSYTGNGTSGLYIWGSQAEESYPTSYIPTSGSTVTRNQDIFTRDGIGSLINSTEGVLFVEMAALSDDLTYRRISLSDSTEDNRISISYDDVSNTISGQVFVGGVEQSLLTYVLSDITEFSKIALKYKVNDFELWVDGYEIATGVSGSVFPQGTLNSLSFDNGSSVQNFFGKVKQLQVYTTTLTVSQLENLTV